MSTPRQSRLFSFVPKILGQKDETRRSGARKVKPSTRDAMSQSRKNSKLTQLPEDILLLIMDNLSKKWKVNVIKTCRYLHRLLEFTVYIHLSPIDPWDEWKCGLLHRTLVGREDLIPYIRSYWAPILRSPIRPSSKQSKILGFWRRTGVDPLSREGTPIGETEAFQNAVFVFSKATNITILEFTGPHDWTSDPNFEPIRGAVSKMPLTRLHLRYYSHPAPVLRAQPTLEHLDIAGANDVQELADLQKTDLPKLKSLRATLEDASLIVPGSPVEHLYLTNGYDNNSWNDERFKNLAESTRPIIKLLVRLDCSWVAERTRRTLQLISRHLQEIEHLIIIVAGCISQQVILDELRSFQCLRSVAFIAANLAISPPHVQSSPQDLIDSTQSDEVPRWVHVLGDWNDLIPRLKGLCPCLVDVKQTPVGEGIACCPLAP